MMRFHALWKSRFVAGTCGLSFILVIIATAIPYFALSPIATPLIVHFTDATGIDRTGQIWDIMEIGILGIMMAVMNTTIAVELEKRRLIWAKFLGLGTLMLSALILIGILAIISVN